MSIAFRQSAAKPPITLCYGPPGVGKTPFGISFKDALFLPTEDGLIGVDGVPMLHSSGSQLIETYDDMLEAIQSLTDDESPYSTVVVDTVSAFERLINAKLMKTDGKTNLEEVGGGYGKWQLMAMPYWEKFVSAIRTLRDVRNVNIVLLGHSQTTEIRSPDQEPYLKYTLSCVNRSDKRPYVEAMFYRESDIVLFINYRIISVQGVESAIAKDKVTKTVKKAGRAIGAGDERVIYTRESPGWHAKNRIGLSAEIKVDDDYESYHNAVSAAFNR